MRRASALALAFLGILGCEYDHLPTSAGDDFESPTSQGREGALGLADFLDHSEAIEIREPPPPSVRGTQLESNTKIFAFSEKHDYVLPGGVLFDLSEAGVWANSMTIRGGVPAFTKVDVHFLHADRESGPADIHLRGTVTFDSEILGVIFTDDKLNFNDEPLGHPDVLYPIVGDQNHADDLRGLELHSDSIRISEDRRSLDVVMNVDTKLDQVRVVVAAGGDDTPPKVLEFEVTPLIVNIAQDPTVNLSITATDSESGIFLIRLFLTDPRGADHRQIRLQQFYTGQMTVTHTFRHDFGSDPILPYPGIWEVSGFVRDVAGNDWEFKGNDPVNEQNGQGGFEITFCDGSIEPRNGNVEDLTFGRLRTDYLKSLSFEPFLPVEPGANVLSLFRNYQDEMESFRGWNSFLKDHDLGFRTKLCEAAGALQGTRSEEAGTRTASALLFSEIVSDLATSIDVLFEDFLVVEDLRTVYISTTLAGPEFEDLLAKIKRADANRSWRLYFSTDELADFLPVPGESTGETIARLSNFVFNLITLSDITKVVSTKDLLGSVPRIGKAAKRAGYIGLIQDLYVIVQALQLLQELWVISEERSASFYDVQEIGLQMRLLEDKYLELYEEETLICQQLKRNVERLGVQGYPVVEITCPPL